MENIVVSIRVRPLHEREGSNWTPLKLTSNAISLCGGPGLSGQTFTFDSVFGPDSKTRDVYEANTKKVILSTVQGFNGTIFAYGQTSSGKTYTMRGCQEEPGIIPLAIQDVFRNTEADSSREFVLRVSYMEIYNEEIKDLLAPDNRKLQVHGSTERGIFVAGLSEKTVESPEQALQLMETGEANRHFGETSMNAHSSRSHTVFRMVIKSKARSEINSSDREFLQQTDPVRLSHLNLVDLAGSERVNKTRAEGTRLKEGTHINKSLMALGNVIKKLSDGVEKQGGHIPYRDSLLTRILQPALGGNAKTLIICNITPALVHIDETRGTLQFASRANRVTNCVQMMSDLPDKKPAIALNAEKLRTELETAQGLCAKKDHDLEFLRAEIRDLRDLVREKQEIIQELKDTDVSLRNEKAVFINQAQENRDKYNSLELEYVSVTEELEKAKKLQEETVNLKRILEGELQGSLETVSNQSLAHIQQVQQLEASVNLYKDRCRELEMEIETALIREQEYRISSCFKLDKLRDEFQSCKRKLSAAEEAKRSLSLENEFMHTSYRKLQVAFDATRMRLEVVEDREEVLEGRLEEKCWEFTEFRSYSTSQLETERGQSVKYLEEIEYLDKTMREVIDENRRLRKTVTEVTEENRKLHDHRLKAEDKAKEFEEFIKGKEAAFTKLQTTFEVKFLRLQEILQSERELRKLGTKVAVPALTKLSMKHDRSQAQSASKISSSSRANLRIPESVEAAKENISSLSLGLSDLRRVPLSERTNFSSFLESESKGETSPQTVRSIRCDRSRQGRECIAPGQKRCFLGTEASVKPELDQLNQLTQDELTASEQMSTEADDKREKFTERDTFPEIERLLQKEKCLSEEVVKLKFRIQELEEENKVIVITHQQKEAELAKRIDDLEVEKDKWVKTAEDREKSISKLMVRVHEVIEAADEADQERKSHIRLVKENKSLSRDLEKYKCKAKDTEATLDSALQDKHKLETEKASMERELRQLRRSTSTRRDINKSDSVDNVFQDKTLEFERLTNELRAVKESYSKLESEMAEAESYFSRQVAELKEQVCQLRDENLGVSSNAEKLRTELEGAQELCEKKTEELEVLQEELQNLRDKLYESENNATTAELLAAELAREKEIAQDWQQRHQSDSSRFRAEVTSLKKQLSAEKAAHAQLVKEKKSLSRNLEKFESKANDAEAKLELALQDMNKLEISYSKLQFELAEAISSSKESKKQVAKFEKQICQLHDNARNLVGSFYENSKTGI